MINTSIFIATNLEMNHKCLNAVCDVLQATDTLNIGNRGGQLFDVFFEDEMGEELTNVNPQCD
jgi:hypothetical protein